MLPTEDIMDSKEVRTTVAATREMIMRLQSLVVRDKWPLEKDLSLAFFRVHDYLDTLMSPIDHASGVADRRVGSSCWNYGLLALNAEVEAYRGAIDELKYEGNYEL